MEFYDEGWFIVKRLILWCVQALVEKLLAAVFKLRRQIPFNCISFVYYYFQLLFVLR